MACQTVVDGRVHTLSCSGEALESVGAPVFPRASVEVVRYRDGGEARERAGVVCECELSIVASGVPLVSLLCSGAALRELAYGFLYSEGVIRALADVRGCRVDTRAMEVSFDLAVPVRRSECPTVSSGLGGKVLCSPLGRGRPDRWPACDADELRGRRGHAPGEGRGMVAANAVGPGAIGDGAARWPIISEVFSAMAAMSEAAVEYRATRGMHCSALFRDGEMLGCYEDIGRHNTFDKLAGRCLLSGLSPEGALLATTGRVSAEMCAKALRLGVAAVSSCSGPTDAAVRLAREAGVMLVGYAGKPGRAVRYA